MGSATRYVSLKKIADGGMAEIFLAHQSGAEGFARPVILKRILPGLSADPQFRDMLVDEAHIAMSLNHGNIVPVLDLGQSRGRYFLVMELVDGWDLATIVRRAKKASFPVPLGLGLHILAEVCRGLAYAHARRGPDGQGLGIVHRDVSPHNVLVGEQGEVKLADFGIAKALGKRGRTRTGVIKGKLDFMSPEQASGQPLAPSSDIFAVGTILYLLATGRRPFEAGSDLEVLLKVQSADFVPLETSCPDFPPRVASIVNKAMQRRPADRYQSGEEMMLDIEEVLRSDFRSPGQSELKRWLAELGSKDGLPTTSQLPALPVDEPLGPIGTGETEALSLDETSPVSAFAETRMRDTGQDQQAAPAPPPSLPAAALPPPLPALSVPVVADPVTPAPPVAWTPPPARRRRRPLPLLRAGMLLLVLGGASYGAHKLLTPRVRTSLTESARGLLKQAEFRSLADIPSGHRSAGGPRAGSGAARADRTRRPRQHARTRRGQARAPAPRPP